MTETMLDRLTVIVPTCDRPDRLCRLLRYYRASGCRAPLAILDSSIDGSHSAAVRAALSAIDAKVSMARYQPETPPLAKMREGLQGVVTPYVVLWADDDFLIPGAFEEGVRLLRNHPHISLVHGQSGLFHSHAGQLQWVAPYPQRAILDETASARLRNHFRRYSVTFYSIYRTEALRKNFEKICRLGLDWHTWGELALSALGVIQGKAYLMDRLYMIREAHAGMGSAVAQQARGIDVFDWLTDLTFSREHGSYEMFRDCLVPELVHQDQTDTASAREVIKQAFWPYLVGQMEKKWRSPVAWHNSAMAARLRSAATHVPGLRRAWRRTQTFLPGQDRAMTLPALLRPTSRYHQDFMPVLDAIAAANGQDGVGGS